MFKFFKKKIPKDNAQEVTVQESWTVEWYSYVQDFGHYGKQVFNARVFPVENDADEYIKQLKECAKFINSTVSVKKKKN